MKPFLLATFAAGLSLAGCAEGTVTSARWVDPVSGVQLEITLTGAHIYLAEFHRALRVVFARSEVNIPLEMDTGGYLLTNIHRLPDRRLMLSDDLSHIVIDPEKETVVETNPPADAAAAEFLGCFDWPQGAAFGFISAADREERKPHLKTKP